MHQSIHQRRKDQISIYIVKQRCVFVYLSVCYRAHAQLKRPTAPKRDTKETI